MTMRDANTSAELHHDTEGVNPEPYMARALDDVVERVMQGERVPKNGRLAITFEDFLDGEVSLTEQTEWLTRFATRQDAASLVHDFQSEMEKRLRAHLEGSAIVEDRAEEMAREAQEE